MSSSDEPRDKNADNNEPGVAPGGPIAALREGDTITFDISKDAGEILSLTPIEEMKILRRKAH